MKAMRAGLTTSTFALLGFVHAAPFGVDLAHSRTEFRRRYGLVHCINIFHLP
jgi:hypothetical protein